jgi:energy-coupling factor transport system permease protein
MMMDRGMTGKYVPGETLLHRMDERAKLLAFLIMICAVIFTDSPAGYAVMFVFMAALGKAAGLSVNSVLSSVRRLGPFLILIFVMNSLFYTSEDPIWHFLIFSLSREGMIQGANVVLRIALVIVMSGILTRTTSPMELMSAIESLLHPLRYIGLPAEEIAMILSIAIQFIPTILEESDEIRKAQIARGARFESGKLRERAMALLPMIVPIFISSFKRADELAEAMEARGYRGAKNRTAKEKKKIDLRSVVMLLVCACVCAVQIVI